MMKAKSGMSTALMLMMVTVGFPAARAAEPAFPVDGNAEEVARYYQSRRGEGVPLTQEELMARLVRGARGQSGTWVELFSESAQPGRRLYRTIWGAKQFSQYTQNTSPGLSAPTSADPNPGRSRTVEASLFGSGDGRADIAGVSSFGEIDFAKDNPEGFPANIKDPHGRGSKIGSCIACHTAGENTSRFLYDPLALGAIPSGVPDRRAAEAAWIDQQKAKYLEQDPATGGLRPKTGLSEVDRNFALGLLEMNPNAAINPTRVADRFTEMSFDRLGQDLTRRGTAAKNPRFPFALAAAALNCSESQLLRYLPKQGDLGQKSEFLRPEIASSKIEELKGRTAAEIQAYTSWRTAYTQQQWTEKYGGQMPAELLRVPATTGRTIDTSAKLRYVLGYMTGPGAVRLADYSGVWDPRYSVSTSRDTEGKPAASWLQGNDKRNIASQLPAVFGNRLHLAMRPLLRHAGFGELLADLPTDAAALESYDTGPSCAKLDEAYFRKFPDELAVTLTGAGTRTPAGADVADRGQGAEETPVEGDSSGTRSGGSSRGAL